MLRYFDNSFKCQLEKLRLDCDHFTESEDEISDRVEQGIIPPVSSENCNLTIFQTCTLILCVILQGRGQSAPDQPNQCRRSDPSLALKRAFPAPPSPAHPSQVSLPSTSASLARQSGVAVKRRHPLSSPPGRRSRFTSRTTTLTVMSTTMTMMPMTTTS